MKTTKTIEKFAPDAKWFLENTNKVIELLQGEGHKPTIPEFESSVLIAERVKNKLREGISGDRSTDDEMRRDATELYATILCTEREACKPLPGQLSISRALQLDDTRARPFDTIIEYVSSTI